MDYNLYWGDMHTHTYCGSPVPFGSVEEATKIARTHLDFFALAEHSNWALAEHPDAASKAMFEEMTKLFLEHWKQMKRIFANNYVPGKFVPIFGYEWANMKHGDYNIYFKDESPEEPLIRNDFAEYIAFAKENKAILIPHHGGYKVGCRGTDWNDFDAEVMPLAEIFSMHGSSERDGGPFPMDLSWMSPRESGGTVLAALERGIKIGFIASSDGHNAYPGCYKMGLVAVYAKELTRESLWESFWKRRVYAVTGDRIKINFKINGHLIGEEFQTNKPRTIYAKVVGDDILDKVEIIKNNYVLYRGSCALGKRAISTEDYKKLKVRVEWGWGGEERWKGELNLSGGKILSAEPCFGPPAPNKILFLDRQRCNWLSHTQGSSLTDWKLCRNGREGTNSIVFEIEGSPKVVLCLKINSKEFTYPLKNLMRNSEVILIRGPFGGKVKIHQAIPRKYYETTVKITDEKRIKDTDFYYLRVTQNNGQMAWSSPMWVNKMEGEK